MIYIRITPYKQGLSITFERYCSEIVLKRENFGWQVHVYILQNCSEKFYDARNWNYLYYDVF